MAEETAPQDPTPAAPPKAAPAAAAAAPAPVEDAGPKEVKIKVRKPKQRSCDYPKDVEAKIGKDAEIYRCEFCKTLYKPDPKQLPHSYTLRY